MAIVRKCDPCEFSETVDDEGKADTLVRDHEAEETTQFVGIQTVEEGPTANKWLDFSPSISPPFD